MRLPEKGRDRKIIDWQRDLCPFESAGCDPKSRRNVTTARYMRSRNSDHPAGAALGCASGFAFRAVPCL